MLAKLFRAILSPPREHVLLIRLLPLAAASALSLDRVSLPRLVELAKDPALAPRFAAEGLGVDEDRLPCIADRASWLVKRNQRCLVRSLLLFGMLSRLGRAPVLRLGVARDGDRLLSHAWVMLDGHPVGEERGVLDSFKPIVSLGSA